MNFLHVRCQHNSVKINLLVFSTNSVFYFGVTEALISNTLISANLNFLSLTCLSVLLVQQESAEQ